MFFLSISAWLEGGGSARTLKQNLESGTLQKRRRCSVYLPSDANYFFRSGGCVCVLLITLRDGVLVCLLTGGAHASCVGAPAHCSTM